MYNFDHVYRYNQEMNKKTQQHKQNQHKNKKKDENSKKDNENLRIKRKKKKKSKQQRRRERKQRQREKKEKEVENILNQLGNENENENGNGNNNKTGKEKNKKEKSKKKRKGKRKGKGKEKEKEKEQENEQNDISMDPDGQNGDIIDGDNCNYNRLPEPAPNIPTYTVSHNVNQKVLSMEELDKIENEHEKKQMIGERLFPIIHQKEPTNAGRITSLILTLETKNAFALIEDENELNKMIEIAKKKIEERKIKEKHTMENIGQKVDEMRQRHETLIENLLSPDMGNNNSQNESNL